MPDIDDRYVDVDFTKEPQYVFGALPPKCFDTAPTFEDSVQVWTDSQIEACIEKMDAGEEPSCEDLITRVFDQMQEGSCVADASSQAVEIIQALQFGKANVVHLSAISLYKRIGSGPMSGSSVNDALAEIQAHGILPLDTPENRAKFGECVMPNTGFYTKFPANWQETAAKFKGVEAFVIRSIAGLRTAQCMKYPVVVGRAGHSICYVRPMKDGKNKYANSWSLQWGDKGGEGGEFAGGFGYDTTGYVRDSAQWCYALRNIVNRD